RPGERERVEERLVAGTLCGLEAHPWSHPRRGATAVAGARAAEGRALPATMLSLGPFHGLMEPAADIFPDRVADRVLDGHGVARLHELLQVHDVPLGQLDHKLADVVRREMDVNEPVDRGADRIGHG